MERLPELLKGYLPKDILNMDELGLIFKTMPQKRLVQKRKKAGDGKQSKERCTVALFVVDNCSKVVTLLFYGDSKIHFALKT